MNISKGTITRTVLLLLALINQGLTVFGINPLEFESETVTEAVSIICTLAAASAAWWKNNSFTREAIQADNTLKKMKGEFHG